MDEHKRESSALYCTLKTCTSFSPSFAVNSRSRGPGRKLLHDLIPPGGIGGSTAKQCGVAKSIPFAAIQKAATQAATQDLNIL